MHAVAAAPSSAQVIDVGLFVAVKEIDALWEATDPVGALVIVTTGADACTVHGVVVADPVPAMFVADTVTECDPTERPETL